MAFRLLATMRLGCFIHLTSMFAMGWIHTTYVNEHLKAITPSQYTFLTAILVPEAVTVWQNTLTPRTGGVVPLMLPRTCEKHHVSPKGCHDVCETIHPNQTCGKNVVIPHIHLAPGQECKSYADGQRHNCSTVSGGVGIPNASFIVYVTARDDKACSSSSAWAEVCRLDGTTDRPLAAYINFCPGALADRKYAGARLDNPLRWSHQRAMAIHEFGHALGFTGSLIALWRHRNASFTPRTHRDTCGHVPSKLLNGIQTLIPSSDTLLQQLSTSGLKKVFIKTSTVQYAVRNMFGCSTIPGAQLENQELPWGSHWETRLFSTEMMSDIESSRRHEKYLSNLTLAFFHDTGWYDANFQSNLVETPAWGFRAGCKFANGPCISTDYKGLTKAVALPFCTAAGALGCSSDHMAIAKCNLVTHTTPVASPEFRYFPSTLKGGNLLNADYCPFYEPIPDGDCRSVSSGHPVGYVDVKGDVGSKCLITDPPIVAPGFATTHGRKPMCFVVQCNTTSRSIAVKIRSGQIGRCYNRGQKLTFPGHEGSIICPSYDLICKRQTSTRTLLNDTAHLNSEPTYDDASSWNFEWADIEIPLAVFAIGLVLLIALAALKSHCKSSGEEEEEDERNEHDSDLEITEHREEEPIGVEDEPVGHTRD